MVPSYLIFPICYISEFIGYLFYFLWWFWCLPGLGNLLIYLSLQQVLASFYALLTVGGMTAITICTFSKHCLACLNCLETGV